MTLSITNIPSHDYTHPDPLASLGSLFGMSPVAVDQARVLEWDSQSGMNLIPMAYQHPDATFLGVVRESADLEVAQEATQELKLENLTFVLWNDLDFSTLKPFDYVIAPRVLSHLVDEVRTNFWKTCKELLAEQGILYVGYPTLPRGTIQQVVREMAQFYTKDISDPHEKVIQSKAFLAMVAQSDQDDVYHRLILDELDFLIELDDDIWTDEVLHQQEEPLAFAEVMDEASSYGFQYLSESKIADALEKSIATETARRLQTESKGDLIRFEQYLDYWQGRLSRRTLFCHQELQLRRELSPTQIQQFRLASTAHSTKEDFDWKSDSPEMFRTDQGRETRITHSLIKLALTYLSEIYPASIPFANLIEEINARAKRKLPPQKVLELSVGLMGLFAREFVELRSWDPTFEHQISNYPKANPVVRYQASHTYSITSATHRTIRCADETLRHLITLLDGKNDREQLILKLVAFLQQEQQTEMQDLENVVEKRIDSSLKQLSRLGILIS